MGLGFGPAAWAADEDGDEIDDSGDNCPGLFNPDQQDTDGDGYGDGCDICPFEFNPVQADNDSDASGNLCDEDDDNDGLLDEEDPDRDGDGMANDWETAYGLDPDDGGTGTGLPSQGGDADLDGDGMRNYGEYVADTIPTDSNSVFTVDAVPGRTASTAHFDSSAARYYTLQGRSSLTGGSWDDVTGQIDIPGTGETMGLSESNAPPFSAYRVRVELP